MKFEYYVLNWNHNKNEYEWFNIFDNYVINSLVEKAVKKYIRNPKKFQWKSYNGKDVLCGFDALCKIIKNNIFYETRARYEYEFSITEPFPKEDSKVYKLDCALECEKNIPIIARECIFQYKQYKKGDKNED